MILISKYINIPLFLISLAFGIFAVYITMPDMRKIYVYPTPDNIDILQYRDKTDSCFHYKQKEVSCPKDESKISKIPVQT
jgi:hypothetical protein